MLLPHHRWFVLSPALPPTGHPHATGCRPQHFAIGHGQTHHLVTHLRITQGSGVHGLPLRAMGCQPTFHHLAVAYPPCRLCD